MLYRKYQGGSFHVLAYWISRYAAAKKRSLFKGPEIVHLVPNSLSQWTKFIFLMSSKSQSFILSKDEQDFVCKWSFSGN